MAKNKAKGFVTLVKKVLDIGQVPQIAVDVTDRSYRSLSEKELPIIMKEVYVADPTGNRTVDKVQIPAMLEPLGRELIDRRMDHEKLLSLAPEIEQAAAILVPSILSPQDFRKNIFEVLIQGGNETDDTKTAIVKLINTHFDTELGLSTKISTWVNEAMFKMGGKPIMILPTTVINKMRDAVCSTESLTTFTGSLIDELDGSLETLDARPIGESMYKDTDFIDNVIGSGIFNDIITDTSVNGNTETSTKRIRGLLSKGLPTAVDAFTRGSLIKFSDDPRFLLKSKLVNSVALESIDSKILSKLGEDPKPFYRNSSGNMKDSQQKVTSYRYRPYLDLSEFVQNDDTAAFPAMIELPYESVLPVIVEGAPTNHIGYFVMINDNGVPISAESDNFGELLSSATGSQRVSNMYNAFYGASQFSMQARMSADAKSAILNSIYDSFLNNMMKTKLNKMGLDKHRVELSSSLSKVMLTRLLKNAQTHILFVPRKLLVYLAFQYNADGTGRSKIDNIKFPLSLKMTLIISRLISLVESCTNRRTLSIAMDDGVGNPLELMRSIKKDYMANKQSGLSYDPSTIIKNTLDKELTIVPNKIPGVTDFSLSDASNTVEYPKADDGLLQEITNMYMLSLGVPPSAMNRLNEDEFSRSVAANNIFFSNQLKTYQRDVCEFMTEIITTYIHFSSKLKASILEILTTERGMSAGIGSDGPLLTGAVEAVKPDPGTDEEPVPADDKATPDPVADPVPAVPPKKDEKDAVKAKEKEKVGGGQLSTTPDDKISDEERLANVIANIKFTLPSPALAQDKSSFEELKDYVEIIDLILTSIYPDDMTANSELSPVVKVMRADAKRNIIREKIKSDSMLSSLNLDSLDTMDLVGTIDSTQKLLNMKAALDNLIKHFTPIPAPDGTDGSTASGAVPSSW